MSRLKLLLFFVVFLLSPLPGYSQERLKIVSTTALNADIVKQVGGEYVDVSYIATPKHNVHFYQPKPSDIKKVRNADIYVSSGLDLEAWSDPLLEAAAKPGLFRGGERHADLSVGIELLKVPETISRSEGDVHLFGNPHYHMNPENVKIMAGKVLSKLKQVDSSHAAEYERNHSDFIARLDQKISEWKSQCQHCAGQELIPYHEDTEYFARFLGLKADRFIEFKPGIPATPKHLEEIVGYGRSHSVKVVTLASYYPKEAAQRVSQQMGAKTVILCQNAGELPGTENVFGFFDYNVGQVSEALK